jgi:hypothetical protein
MLLAGCPAAPNSAQKEASHSCHGRRGSELSPPRSCRCCCRGRTCFCAFSFSATSSSSFTRMSSFSCSARNSCARMCTICSSTSALLRGQGRVGFPKGGGGRGRWGTPRSASRSCSCTPSATAAPHSTCTPKPPPSGSPNQPAAPSCRHSRRAAAICKPLLELLNFARLPLEHRCVRQHLVHDRVVHNALRAARKAQRAVALLGVAAGGRDVADYGLEVRMGGRGRGAGAPRGSRVGGYRPQASVECLGITKGISCSLLVCLGQAGLMSDAKGGRPSPVRGPAPSWRCHPARAAGCA